ncbi:MAG: gfo/Idh/MocA family oxidoreductase, partial [Opitutaceae bacterium]
MPPIRPLRLGLLGLDTSHVEGFAELFNNPAHPDYIRGGRIVAGFPGASPDFGLSAGRVDGFTRKLRERYGLAIVGSPRELAESVDAILLTAVDGRAHRAQFTEIAPLRRPVFMDKPFATTHADARAIAELSRMHGTPLFTSSSLRFAGSLQAALAERDGGRVVGAEFSGPLKLEPTQPGFFWYGIHPAEMLYAALGPGCGAVRVSATAGHEAAIGTWRDGRIGVLRGHRAGYPSFAGVVHREERSQWVDAAAGRRADAGLAAAIMAFFRGGPPPVPLE